MARHGYGMSVSGSKAFVVPSSGGAAPSGIPVATETIIVTNAGSFNGTYVNNNPNVNWYDGFDSNLQLNPPWRFINTETNAELNNPSSDANYIPTTGWTQNGSPIAITITAA